ncbi:MAG: cyclic pyranopterin monophosphate synthase MoaC [Candidatus Omnitrophica bacterium]|nr:cyclic pyranopterin monophosphate synthase MoaC [Candidatus Omnitrophota bacterium]
MTTLTHIDAHGRARMVDVSAKMPTRRQALVEGRIIVSRPAFAAIQRQALAKGDALTVAKLAGMQAAKRTDELIPLCHPLPLEHLDLTFEPDPKASTIRVVCEATTTAKTGIEMEAMTATSIALLTLYDMVKAVDPAATITDLRLVSKTGGKRNFLRK